MSGTIIYVYQVEESGDSEMVPTIQVGDQVSVSHATIQEAVKGVCEGIQILRDQGHTEVSAEFAVPHDPEFLPRQGGRCFGLSTTEQDEFSKEFSKISL